MPFGKKATDASFAHRYEITRISGGLDWVDEQLKMSHQFFNTLVALRKDLNSAIEAKRCEVSPAYRQTTEDISRISADISAIYQGARKRSKSARKRVPMTDAEEAALEPLREQQKGLFTQLKKLRKDANIKDWLKDANKDDKEKKDAARKEFAAKGLHWCNYNGVIDSLNGEPFPQFKRYEGVTEGRLCFQFQRSAEQPDRQPKWADIENNRWEEKAPYFTCSVFKTHPKRGKLISLELSWAPKRPPITVSFWLHRPIPADARITGMMLTKRAQGYRFRWGLVFSLAVKERVSDCANDGWCVIDWNHRLMPSGDIRVARWRDHQDNTGDILLPAALVGSKGLVEELQGIRDRLFDAALPAVVAALPKDTTTTPVPPVGARDHALPDWFPPTLAQWQSQRRLWDLYHQWREARFPGDEASFGVLSRWYYDASQHHHKEQGEKVLAPWEADTRRKIFDRREAIFRQEVARLRRRYHTFVVEKTDHAKMRKTPPPDQAKNPALILYRNLAAPRELLSWLKMTAADVVEIDPAYSTKRCHVCKKLTDWKGELIYQCEHCGETWDCDDNATANLRDTWLEGK